MLDLARSAQGVGAAAMFAASLAVLANEFQGAQRGFALGVWGAITGGALAVGPLVGGLLVDGLGWRWVFLVNLPIGAVLVWLTLRSLPESRDSQPRGLDLPGLVSLGAFVVVERRADSPMLAPALFRIPACTGTAVVAFAQSIALYPLFLFLAVYLQQGLGYSATETGLRLLPLTLVLFAVAPISGRLTGRVPFRVPLVTGLVLIAVGLLLMRGLTEASDWTHLLPGFVVGGLAIGVISPALAAAMVGVLSADQVGLASGINNTFRQLGIAVGIAVLGAVFTHHAGGGGLSGLVEGLDAVFLVAALIAAAGAVAAWPLLGGFGAGPAAGHLNAR